MALINQHKRYAMTGKLPNDGMAKGGSVKKGRAVKASKTTSLTIAAAPGADAAMSPAPLLGAAAPMTGAPANDPDQDGMRKGGRAKAKRKSGMPHLARGGSIGGMKDHGCDRY